MLYKVTPMLTPPEKKPAQQAKDPNAPKEPRKRRRSAVFDADGHEVLITMMCLKCRSMKPLAMFGLRKMADGAIRNQPWCRTCRSGASTKKKEQLVDPQGAHAVEQPVALEVGVVAAPHAAEQLPLVAAAPDAAGAPPEDAADESEGEADDASASATSPDAVV